MQAWVLVPATEETDGSEDEKEPRKGETGPRLGLVWPWLHAENGGSSLFNVSRLFDNSACRMFQTTTSK